MTGSDAVEVRRSVVADMAAHARAEAPRECCGLLIGRDRRIERALRARNDAVESATRYQIHPEDHFAAIRSARASGEEIVGFYHSHPRSSPVPSATDNQEAAYPGMLYVIVSLLAGADELRAYQLTDSGNFVPLRLVQIP